MASMLKKGMSWLGLGPDEDYDDFDYVDPDDHYADDDYDEPQAERAMPASRPVSRRRPPSDADWDDAEPGGIRVLPASDTSSPVVSHEPSPRRSVVRPLPSPTTTKPHVVSPRSFNDAQEVGDWFKRRQPVIVNLQGLDRDLARRLLDFASGVTYGLGGSVERVASHVYLLTPADVEVSDDDRRRITAGALVDETSS
jgi:cell division inhibitor SepF